MSGKWGKIAQNINQNKYLYRCSGAPKHNALEKCAVGVYFFGSFHSFIQVQGISVLLFFHALSFAFETVTAYGIYHIMSQASQMLGITFIMIMLRILLWFTIVIIFFMKLHRSSIIPD